MQRASGQALRAARATAGEMATMAQARLTQTRSIQRKSPTTQRRRLKRQSVICSGRLDNPTIDKWFDTSCFVPVTETTGTYGDTKRGSIRGPGSVNVDLSVIKNTQIGKVQTEVRIEAFNIFNHLQFANPNTQIGNAAVGTISSLLSSASCSLCGTTERQVQLGFKMRF